MFRTDNLDRLGDAHKCISDYYRDVRALVEVIDTRFRMPEYGVGLAPIGGAQLHSNANSYLLADDSAYPFYLWLPSWFGRFYVEAQWLSQRDSSQKLPTEDAGPLAFVWPWLGIHDAYLPDPEGPECWVGVAVPMCEDPGQDIDVTADAIFKYFRYERTKESESDGWSVGALLGPGLGGTWYLRRVPLSALTTYYEIECNVVRPVAEKFAELGRVRPAEMSQ